MDSVLFGVVMFIIHTAVVPVKKKEGGINNEK